MVVGRTDHLPGGAAPNWVSPKQGSGPMARHAVTEILYFKLGYYILVYPMLVYYVLTRSGLVYYVLVYKVLYQF